MDLDLIRQEAQPKVPIQITLYQSTIDKLQKIAKKEGTKQNNLIRHAINEFFKEYDAAKN